MIVIKDILEFLNEKKLEFSFVGQKEEAIDGFSSLFSYKENTITWNKHRDFAEKNLPIKYKLMVSPVYNENACENCIITEKPKAVFFSVLEKFFSTENTLPDVGKGTYISENVKIGTNVKIGYNCVLDGNIKIGDNTVIYNNVSIINSVDIGRNCVIQSGTIIGHDDYSFVENEDHRKTMVKHYGGIKIGDDVWLGPQCVVNRGTIDDTEIRRGCKIDAQCVVSHNVILRENSALICGAKLFGSVDVGENAYIASAIVKNQLKLGNNVVVGMGSVVLKDIEDDVTAVGVPASVLRKNK